MANGKFIAYYRVSTQKQGQSGLGLDAQKQAVLNHLNGGDWELLGDFVEVETGKGSDALDRRPQLKAAIDACKKQGATLIIAKLDRLARNVHFISGLLETGVDFVCADMPQANKVMLQMYSVMAEWERDQISVRTKAALAAAKARGVVLGAAGAANLKPNIEARQQTADNFAGKLKGVIDGMVARGLSQRGMIAELNQLGIKTARGGAWSLVQLQRVMSRF
ncbi:recombinase family protein [Methylobacter sp.]|uniref:recombinase family protein n=1 Tax=Methylobacter sp. TaxID=2051955 RepID=UPI0012059789|nr:recombinase family protein [Methylobacter sp.]TAK62301.1 MAG: recombinase family protein [Methylobacter sp.]